MSSVIGLCLVGLALWIRSRIMHRAQVRRVASDRVNHTERHHPSDAADWPEFRLDTVVFDPDTDQRVLLMVHWPTQHDLRALLVLDIDDPMHDRRLFAQWRDGNAAVSPIALGADRLLLRTRSTNDTVRARLVDQTA